MTSSSRAHLKMPLSRVLSCPVSPTAATAVAMHWGERILPMPAPVELAAASQNWDTPMEPAASVWRAPSSTSVLVPLPVTKAPMAAIMGETKG